MVDGELIVINALEEDEELLKLLQVTDEYWKIHRTYVPQDHSTRYPYLRVSELDNYNNTYADDKPLSSFVPVQIDLWVQEGDDTLLLTQAIERVMESLSYRRTGVTPFHDEGSNSVRKALRYENTILLGEE